MNAILFDKFFYRVPKSAANKNTCFADLFIDSISAHSSAKPLLPPLSPPNPSAGVPCEIATFRLLEPLLLNDGSYPRN